MRLFTPFRVAFVVWLIVTVRMTFELTDAEMTRAFIVTQVQLVAALVLVPIILRRRSHADESCTDGSARSKAPAGRHESATE